MSIIMVVMTSVGNVVVRPEVDVATSTYLGPGPRDDRQLRTRFHRLVLIFPRIEL